MAYISDSHKYNFQLSSIRILAVVRPSWFYRSERAFSAILGHTFQNLPYKESVTNPNKISLFETSKCLLLC